MWEKLDLEKLIAIFLSAKVALDRAWEGMLQYWETRGTEADLW